MGAPTIPVKRGDVVTVGLPVVDMADPSHVQRGRRRAVIVQADLCRRIRFGDGREIPSSTIVVIPMTSKLKGRALPAAFEIIRSATNGLDVDSIVLTDQITTVDLRDIKEKHGELSPEDLQRLDDGVRHLLAL